jgi:hypothetical protein
VVKLLAMCALILLGAVTALVPTVGAQTVAPNGRVLVPAPGVGMLLPASPTVDVVFTPITPCRIIDTTIAGGPIDASETRDFAVAGIDGFAAQGGNAAGCGIPLGASAAVINYVAVGPAGPGDLRVTAFGTPIPLASVINYANVPGLNIANGVATPLAPGAAPHITVQADVSATHLVADVLGYYKDVSCQAGSVKVLGQCFETSLRSAADVFNASIACKTAGGRLATPHELRSVGGPGLGPLTLDGVGEWVDSYWTDGVTILALIVNESGQFTSVDTLTPPHPYRCVFRPLP